MRSASLLFMAGVSTTAVACSCDRAPDPPPAGSLVVRARQGVINLDGEIPKDFPLEIMPGSSPTAALASEAPKGKRRILRLENDEGALRAIEFYDRDLRRRGFGVERIETEEDDVPTTILRGASEAGEVDVAVRRRRDGLPGTVVRIIWTNVVPQH